MKKDENNKQPLVSVVVPIYNSGDYLSRCIESICGQTYKNIEIILVNDGSTDDSHKIAQRYAKKDSRIKIINQKNSGGIIARRNGINNAEGEYVLLEDSDDWLDEELVEKCVGAINKYRNVDIVKFGYINEPSKVQKNILNEGLIKKNILEDDEINQIYEHLLYDTSCNQIWNQMVKKCLFDFNDEIFDYVVHKGEDLQINLQIFEKAKKVVVLKDNLYYYLNNPDGVTNDISVAKVINNTKDSIYLNSLRNKIAFEKFGHASRDYFINRTLSLLSGKIVRILANNKNPKADLLKMKEGFGNELSCYINGFNASNLNQDILKKMISSNIIKGDYLKNLRYKPICKILKAIGKLK